MLGTRPQGKEPGLSSLCIPLGPAPLPRSLPAQVLPTKSHQEASGDHAHLIPLLLFSLHISFVWTSCFLPQRGKVLGCEDKLCWEKVLSAPQYRKGRTRESRGWGQVGMSSSPSFTTFSVSDLGPVP